MAKHCVTCESPSTTFDCYTNGVEWEIEAKYPHEAAEKFALLLSPSIREVQYGNWNIEVTIKDKLEQKVFEVTVIYTGYHCSTSPKLISSKRST